MAEKARAVGGTGSGQKPDLCPWQLRGRIYASGDTRALSFIPYASPVASGMRPIVGQEWILTLETFFLRHIRAES